MNTFDNIIQSIEQSVAGYTSDFTKLFIVRNIFGRIKIFIENLKLDISVFTNEISTRNVDMSWIESIELIDTDSLLFKELNSSSVSSKHANNVFINERRLTRLNWFTDKNQKKSAISNDMKIVSFYSYKGGVGRTTALAASALELVRRGHSLVLIDFDIEAPGLASLFFSDAKGEEYYNVKGVVDFILDSNVKKFDNEYDLDDYYINIVDSDIIGTQGGSLVIVPAGSISEDNASNYIEKISRLDFNLKAFSSDKSPIITLFKLIEKRFKPDFLFIDCRTGINDIGGLAITKLSDLVVMVFYGNLQNMLGLRMTIPIVKSADVPILLVNSPVPTNKSDEEEEIEFYTDNSYSIFCDYYYEDDIPEVTDKSALHYPLNVYYSNDATNLSDPSRLVKLISNSRLDNPYIVMAEHVERTITKPLFAQETKNYNERNIHIAISKVMPDFNQTAAGEHEFLNEDDLRKRFYPRKDYKFIFESDRFLILGEKGVGKTTLFTVLSYPSYAKHLAKYCGVGINDYNATHWIKGLDNSSSFPTTNNFSMLNRHNFSQLKNYWMCLLVRCIAKDDYIKSNCETKLIKKVIQCDIPDLNAISRDFSFIEKLETWLTDVQLFCESQGKKINIIYDYLDLLIPDASFRGELIAALISFWFINLNRYRNIRSKIFLRQDIFDREVESSLTDKLKIKNYSVAIKWEYDQLLNIIWKRMLEESSDVEMFFRECLKDKYVLLSNKTDPLGYIPLFDKEANWMLLDNFFGKYMGSNNKAFPYNWITYHLSDTNDNISPRSIIMLFALTAREQLDDNSKTDWLIRPYNMEKCMAKVSEARLQDLKEEYPSFLNIFNQLKEHEQYFPVEDTRLKETLLMIQGEEGVQKTIERLMEIGVLKSYKRKAKNNANRYHIPDIYLLGLGLTRKGPSYHRVFKKK